MMVLDLPTSVEWKAELTKVAGYIGLPTWFTRTQTVANQSTNRARCRARSRPTRYR